MGRAAKLLVLLVALSFATALAGSPAAAQEAPEPAEAAVPAVEAVDPAVEAVDPVPAVEPVEVPGAGAEPNPGIGIEIRTDDPGLSRSVLLILLMGVGSIAPAIVLLMTSFTRFVVVLALVRNAIGLQGIPPTQVLVGLALFMTFFAMAPTFSDINDQAVQPALAGEVTAGEAMQKGFEPLRAYMLEQTSKKDLGTFASLQSGATVQSVDEVSPSALIPAFVVSELRRAFLIGFLVFLPFLIIDLAVSATLMSLGMVMVPPIVISLPVKLLLFVLVDGWGLIVRSLMASVTGGPI